MHSCIQLPALSLPGAGQFECQLTVPGYSWKTRGTGAKKADAQEEAAEKFVTWLEKEGKWTQAETASPLRAAPTPLAVCIGPRRALDSVATSLCGWSVGELSS